ncbi:MAG: hypothetical protein D6718_09100 [Acidobacteria bacterium]|nr:MAG: hypothetical protein D6718_09100 [Acidobacteriota bacterium]
MRSALASLAATAAVFVAADARGAPRPDLIILATGNVVGYVDECGCPRAPMGGLDKRGGYVSALRRAWGGVPFLLLDAGNFADIPGPGGDVKTRGIVTGMNLLDYAASGVGERDLASGVEHFRAVTSEADFPFLSANLVREEDGRTWIDPGRLFRRGELQVAVTAVTRHNPLLRLKLPDGGHVVTRDPAEALAEEVPRLRGRADMVVLLALLPLEETRRLVEAVPGIDVVVGAYGDRLTADPVRVGRTLVLYTGDQGKHLAEIHVFREPDGRLRFDGRTIGLTRAIAPDPTLEEHMVSVLAEAQEAERMRLTALPSNGGEGRVGSGGYLGSGACTPCHAEIVESWSRTAHAAAFRNLLARAGRAHPNCVACHSTGYGRPGGFVDREMTPHLAEVGCEACHGPAAGHVARPAQPYGKVTLPTCTACHTAEQDPSFNFYEARHLVDHGASGR